jgi:hypothetical protein
MGKNKSSISKASSYEDIGAYWDIHDLSKIWHKTKKVKFDVQIESEVIYYPIEKSLSEKIQSIAKRQGISSDTLINLWVQQKVQEQVFQ